MIQEPLCCIEDGLLRSSLNLRPVTRTGRVADEVKYVFTSAKVSLGSDPPAGNSFCVLSKVK